ncbi:PEP-CTERM sorting domain-containing protein [Methylotuvimicrobium buryatense]|uniref:PEP-CTERM sorting domain-containing protein n=1 Tax=Methylotuvimicrobium buryatense TaxID=95641 RepID=A0A4P9UV83_METBY|nr:PEP-CTERM sorting domain-containing protein [Methylotuvimicrobium buryatense]QCW84341.1 PEP-CTERM sorting domain-containing protein [Methylotuvimicrobium buryatense]
MRLCEPVLLWICIFLLGVPLNSTAAIIACNANDAMANGFYANACVGDDNIKPKDEQAFVIDNFQDDGDAFSFIGKFNDGEGFESSDSDIGGFTLSVSKLSDPNTGDYFFSYALLAPEDWLGKFVDWTLLVKQANNSVIAYLFSGITLGIDGGFNSRWTNPREKIVNDYSHVSGFIRLAEDRGISTLASTVPEPSLTLLFSIGLLGLGARSQIKRKHLFGM